MIDFVYPYIQVLLLAARELLQLYETYARGSVRIFTAGSLNEHLGVSALVLSLLLIVSTTVTLFSIYKRKKFKGLIVCLIVFLIPGFWALYDIQTFIFLLDKPYKFSAGGSPFSNEIGDIHGALSLLFVLMFFGWSLFLFFQTIFEQAKVKAFIDHFWYPAGLTLGVIFIISQAKETEEWTKHKEMEQLYSERAESLLAQNRIAFEYLRNYGGFNELSQEQKSLLIEYFKRAKYFFRNNGTKAGFVPFDGFADMFTERSTLIQQTLNSVNERECKKGTWLLHCYYWNLKDWELTNSELDYFGSPVLIPYQYFDVMSDLSHKINNSFETFRETPPIHSVRMLVFCLLAILAGAKVATASVTFLSISDHDAGDKNGKHLSFLINAITSPLILFFKKVRGS